MDLKFGLISADSHGQLGKNAYTSRMSQAKWGDRIPHVIEVRDEKFDFPVERWVVNAPQEAIAAPRFSHIEGAKVGLEPDFGQTVRGELTRRGHQVSAAIRKASVVRMRS